jgi:hypothetical protein
VAGSMFAVRAPSSPSSADRARVAPEDQETTEYDLQWRCLHEPPSPKIRLAASFSSAIACAGFTSSMQRVEP